MKSNFPEPYTHIKKKQKKTKIEAELYLSNYAAKSALKDATGVASSDSAKKVDLVNLKSDVDKLGIDKLKNCIKWFKKLPHVIYVRLVL